MKDTMKANKMLRAPIFLSIQSRSVVPLVAHRRKAGRYKGMWKAKERALSVTKVPLSLLFYVRSANDGDGSNGSTVVDVDWKAKVDLDLTKAASL